MGDVDSKMHVYRETGGHVIVKHAGFRMLNTPCSLFVHSFSALPVCCIAVRICILVKPHVGTSDRTLLGCMCLDVHLLSHPFPMALLFSSRIDVQDPRGIISSTHSLAQGTELGANVNVPLGAHAVCLHST